MIIWKIPVISSALGVRANVGDSAQTVTLDPSPRDWASLTLSPDLTRVALLVQKPGTSIRYLDIHDVSPGRRIARAGGISILLP